MLRPELHHVANKVDTEHCRWDKPVATLQINGCPLTMAFHSYDQHLIIANENDMIRCDLGSTSRIHQLIIETAYGTGRSEHV